MEYRNALSQITEIHAHLARGEMFRDYRALPIAASGLVTIAASLLQSTYVHVEETIALQIFVFYWCVVAAICAVVCGAQIALNYVTKSDSRARRHTRIVLGQFTPCLAAGVIVTVVLLSAGDVAIRWLPGLWAIFMSMGIFASRPYLPRAIGFVGLFYFIAGGCMLIFMPKTANYMGYAMGISFGIGQLFSGAVLYWNLERKS